jgi:hypothetical protein
MENENTMEIENTMENENPVEVELKELLEKPDDTPEEELSEIEKQLLKKEQRRVKYNAYHRDYYKNNKEKFNKHVQPGRKRGERGKSKSIRYRLSIMNLQSGKSIMSQDFKSFGDIGETLQLPAHTISMIYRGKYQSGMGKQRKTKEYARYRIEKI